jgi:hypothetical protein
VEAVLPSTQHRETGASRVCAVASERKALERDLGQVTQAMRSNRIRYRKNPRLKIDAGKRAPRERRGGENRLEKGFFYSFNVKLRGAALARRPA